MFTNATTIALNWPNCHLRSLLLQVTKHGSESWRLSNAAQREVTKPPINSQQAFQRQASNDSSALHQNFTVRTPPHTSHKPSSLPFREITSEPRLLHYKSHPFPLQRQQIEQQRDSYKSTPFDKTLQQRQKQTLLSSQQRPERRETVERDRDKFLLPPSQPYLPSPETSVELSSTTNFSFRKSLPETFSTGSPQSQAGGKLYPASTQNTRKTHHSKVRLPPLRTALEMSSEERDNACSNCFQRG